MKIEFFAYKNTSERLLFELITNDEEFAVVWPDSSLFYTNAFDAGSEFIRLSELPVDYSLFEINAAGQWVLLSSQTVYNDGIATIAGKVARNLRLSNIVDLSAVGSGYIDVLNQLMLIRNDIEQLQGVE